MTERMEIKEALEDFEMFCTGKALCVTGEALEMVRNAIKEIQQYRAIGTVDEFKDLKEVDDDLRLQYCYEDLSISENRGYMQGYNKAIDEFAKCLKERWIETEDLNLSSEFFKFVDKVAEQMKGGATDERICRKTD